jgi:hypothetical protein
LNFFTTFLFRIVISIHPSCPRWHTCHHVCWSLQHNLLIWEIMSNLRYHKFFCSMFGFLWPIPVFNPVVTIQIYYTLASFCAHSISHHYWCCSFLHLILGITLVDQKNPVYVSPLSNKSIYQIVTVLDLNRTIGCWVK